MPKTTRSLSLLIIFLALLGSNALANQKIEGCFVAKMACEALHSIKKKTNPNHIKLDPYGLYAIIAKNKLKPTHYLIKIPNIETSERWVPISCGNYVPNCRLSPLETLTTDLTKQPQYLLALSWEPTFCETHQQKTECKTLTADRHDASHLSLHGLWPQPKNNAYCNVDASTKAIDRRKKWHLIKELDLSDTTRSTLAKIMPGYASNLQRHEWTKHGTCYGTSADLYYQHSIQLTQAVNQSHVGRLLANNIGKKVTAKAIRTAFDESFGAGAGSKVNVRCDKKGRLAELWINLSGKISQSTELKSLLKNASTAKNRCETGIVDPAT